MGKGIRVGVAVHFSRGTVFPIKFLI